MLARLREYKEFIAILAFFIAGFLWIYGFFATKSEVKTLTSATKSEVKTLKCLLNTNILAVTGQLDAMIKNDEVVTINLEITKLEEKKEKGLNALENQRFEGLKVKRDLTMKELIETRKTNKRALRGLASSACDE